ncbi:c-type cytochrome [Oceanithermus desulfurans]|uniref:Cytochrome c domain-containing protein n=2 Tax=Oceanithermus desulfurans TaxID=227924 RepID=A0A511RH19_9DEIN|nr:cytochrome c [Oceanithermus desulfurans]MBB6028859.1 mono/diheme cytochrome c family protein [Oceanithermus desulfurans]GEM88918.1 hypothetical protein ODE01S_03520 [Oceanithermus desulfurans NBRC 100063]
MRKTLVLASLLWLAGAAWAGGAELYAQNCASCHGPGGEGVAGVFPPLAGNPRAADAAYVARVVRNGLSGPLTVGDRTYSGSMPPFAQLSDADVEALAGYVAGRLAAVGAAPAPGPGTTAAAAAGDPEAGRAYFLGKRRFARGATPCVACHDAPGTGALGGGTLGPDLSDAGARFGAGLAQLLERPGFKVMRSLYGDRPLTPEEARDVAAFLASGSGAPAPAARGWRFAGLGALGTLLLFLVLFPFWPRQRESYRDRLLRRKA